ncbi:MAG TPA: PAS domain-containing protein [Gemmatimonadales bacterium]|nr:PAS domain-containing protein [Gemmatimonadales bacterium]
MSAKARATEERRPLRALLLEHHQPDAELVGRALEKGGFAPTVTLASTQADFTRLLAGPPCDVILADYRLPQWTAMDALALLKTTGRDIPFIIVTGTLGEERAVECLKEGAADYVTKEHLERLPAAVHRALEDRRLRSERTQAVAELREREERFRQVVENIQESFFILDLVAGRTVYISPAYERLWGRSCQSMYDDPRSFLEPIFPEDRVMLEAAIAKTARGEPRPSVEFRVRHPDGSVRWLTSHAVPIRDEQGRVCRLVGAARDITDRKAAEAALEASESGRRTTEIQLDHVLVSSGAMLSVTEFGPAEARAVWVSPNVHRILGYTVVEALTPGWWMERLHPEDRERVLESVPALLSTGSRYLEYRFRHKNGTWRWLRDDSRVLATTGRTTQVVHAFQDVTDLKQLEDQYRQSQKMEAVGRLAGGVAHDFNNLLTAITGYADLLLEDLPAGGPHRADVREIRAAASRATDLTRQLLAFSRQQVLQPKVLDLNAVVRDAQSLLQRVIGEDVRLEIHLTPEPGRVKADPGQLEQVIINLAVNARDAMPKGGRLTIGTDIVRLDEAFARTHHLAVQGPHVMLAVTDTGTGIPLELQAHIFESFFTTKERGKGTGLGLATVYGIVKQSGGAIWVYSEPGKGATFKVYLPQVEELAELLDAARHPATPPPAGTETILLAEDDPAVRAIAREILDRAGYTVLLAPSGQQALDAAKQFPGEIHLLMTDVVMPGMSGRQLAEALLAVRPGVRALFTSGYTDDVVLRHGVLEEGVPYLQKPFTADALARKVREVLDGKR